MKKLAILLLCVLSACNPLMTGQNKALDDFPYKKQQCQAQLDSLNSKTPKKKFLAALLKANECERLAAIEAFDLLGTDLINLSYSKRAVVYEKFIAHKITYAETMEALNQIQVDLISSIKQRSAQDAAMQPPKRMQTHCIPDYVGGVMCQSY